MKKPLILSCGVFLTTDGEAQTDPGMKRERKGFRKDLWRKKAASHQLDKDGNPSEVPPPDKTPEIKPDLPEKPLLPAEEPEIQPEKEPAEPPPGEIPLPKAKSGK